MANQKEREIGASVCETIPRYVKRPLAEVVARTSAPVVILEGAPGVGKTALVKNEEAFRNFHYVTLADEGVYAEARKRPRKWATSLPRPVVIDEVHRVASLVGTIRRLAPKESANRPEFVLLSSEALPIEKSTAPKPERFTLFPLTQAEIYGREGCIVDDLFDGVIYRKFRSMHTRSDLRTKMRVGGFPFRVTHPVSALSSTRESRLPFQDDLRVLGEKSFGPQTSIEQLIEQTILKKVLPNPGLSLGVDAVAQSCSVDAATLIEHVRRYHDKFLVHHLTMLDKQPSHKYAFAKTRVHPMDTALAVEALSVLGYDITVDMSTFAKVLRTLCINQLVPATQWASERTEYHHWKKFDRRIREVDLVLSRGDRLVGITIRNSLAARSDTIGALRFLAEDERFVRGFIIYMGPFPRQLTDNIWAIPVSALWERCAFFEGAVEMTAARVAHAAAAKATHVVTTAAKALKETTANATAVTKGKTATATTTTTVTTTVTTSTTVEAAVIDSL